MKQNAIQFIKSPLTDSSICAIFVGSNSWFKKQIREKIQEKFGKIQKLEFNEESLTYVADAASSPPIYGGRQKFFYISGAEIEETCQWFQMLETTVKDIFILVDFQLKKDDKRTYDSQVKAIEKINKNILIIEAYNPSDEKETKSIISLILKSEKLDEALVSKFYLEYGHDFESCEENAKKINANGEYDSLLFDKKDISMKEVWAFVDRWIEGKLNIAIKLLDSLEHSNINSYSMSNQIARQFRTHIIAIKTKKGHPSVLSRISDRNQTWFMSTYLQLLQINPIEKTYLDKLRYCVLSTCIL